MKAKCTPKRLPFNLRKKVLKYISKDDRIFFCCYEGNDAAYVITNRRLISHTMDPGPMGHFKGAKFRIADIHEVTGYRERALGDQMRIAVESLGFPIWHITFDRYLEIGIKRHFIEGLEKAMQTVGVS